MTGSALIRLACIRCGNEAPRTSAGAGCTVCGDSMPSNLTTVYDLDKAARTFRIEAVKSRPPGLWRYEELLPVDRADAVTLGEGGTPLVPAPRLARRLGLRELWIKDESRNPTWSFKDRGAAMSVSVAQAEGRPGVIVSSTGNAAAATGAYARRAGVPAIILVTQGIDPTMRSHLSAYTPAAVATRTKAQRWTLMEHCVSQWKLFPNSNFEDPPVGNNPYAVDGYKTIGLEIWDQLGFQTPDWVFISAGYGDGLYGMYKGFAELADMGLSRVPGFGAGEISGSLTTTLATGDERVHRSSGTEGTIALSISNPQSTYQAVAALRRSQGTASSVTNDELLESQRLLARTEGLFVEISSAAALAALAQAVDGGAVEPDARVVVVNTSSGLKSAEAFREHEPEVPLADDADQLEAVLRTHYAWSM